MESPWNVVIFGGSSGIGEAVARELLADQAMVTIIGRDRDRLTAAAARLGNAVLTQAVDGTDQTAISGFFADQNRTVDHLVLSFSSGRAGGPFKQLQMTELLAALSGKLVAYLSIIQASLPWMRSNGSITMIGAGSAESSLPATAGLAAVNGGLHAAVRPLAVELAPLRVNAVAPGVIETPWWAAMPASVRAGVFTNAASAPAGRVGTARDVAMAVVLLIECEYITGAVIPCDGGLRLK